MSSFSTRRIAGIIAGAAILSACGGSQVPIATPFSAAQRAAGGTKTFKYTGAAQSFKVPAGVTHITIKAYGGGTPSFRNGPSGPFSIGNLGGFVQADIPVRPGESLAIYVGGAGQLTVAGQGGLGGFNGGASGGEGNYGSLYANGGTGGAGSSDVRQGGNRLKNRVLVAGGAGGGGTGVGFYGAGTGGVGGGLTGGTGGGPSSGGASGSGGQGGSQTAGGQGGPGGRNGSYPQGAPGNPGKLHHGGSGGAATPSTGGGGGGGGGGLYGGGGGGAGGHRTSGVGGGGGGGGGSSWVEKRATHVKNVQGGANHPGGGNGKVVISW
jgi:hypothetical protein